MSARWEVPIVVRTASGEIAVSSPKEAIDFMEQHWPANKGFMYAIAKRRCASALQKPDRARAARLSFHAAVVENDMFPDKRENRLKADVSAQMQGALA